MKDEGNVPDGSLRQLSDGSDRCAQPCLLSIERTITLASRSPRRLELLSLIVPRERIRVLPPATAREASFNGLHTWDAIRKQLLSIATAKLDDVLARAKRDSEPSCIVAADTIVVVGNRDDEFHVLGQPPENNWRESTKRWFRDHYLGQSHTVLTGLVVATSTDREAQVVESRVTFRSDLDAYVDAYVATGEPRGKAGGYAIQGLGSLFVHAIEGSLTNAIGLPISELVAAFERLHLIESTPKRR